MRNIEITNRTQEVSDKEMVMEAKYAIIEGDGWHIQLVAVEDSLDMAKQLFLAHAARLTREGFKPRPVRRITKGAMMSRHLSRNGKGLQLSLMTYENAEYLMRNPLMQ